MPSSYVIFGLLVFVAVGYGVFFGRGGVAGRYRRLFACPPGESIAHLWFGAHHWKVNAGVQVAAAMVGVRFGGKPLVVALSDTQRLLLKDHETRGQVYAFGPMNRPAIEDIGDAGSTFSGERGIEPGRLLRLTPPGGVPFEIGTTASAAAALLAWSQVR